VTTIVVKESYRLGNLDFARYFDHAIGVLRELFRPVAAAYLMLLLPPLLVFLVIDLAFGFSAGMTADSIDGMTPEAFFAFWIRGVGAVTSYSLLFQILLVYLCAMVSLMVGMHYLGTPVTLGEAFRFVLSRFFKIIVAHIVYFLVVSVGFMLCFVPGIIFGVWLYIFVPAILFEDAGPMQALQRSRHLISQGEFLRILFIWFALGFVGAPVALVDFIIPEPAVVFFLQTLVGAVLQVFGAALVTVVYFSLRCKHEALDLEILASHIDLEDAAEAQAL